MDIQRKESVLLKVEKLHVVAKGGDWSPKLSSLSVNLFQDQSFQYVTLSGFQLKMNSCFFCYNHATPSGLVTTCLRGLNHRAVANREVIML